MQSPLRELHRANGAEFIEEDGWVLPAHFGGALREYEAVRSHVGLLDLCHRTLVQFTGPDRVSYLQGMVSNDIRKLSAGEGIHAAILDIHGKILADVRIFSIGDSFLLEIWEPLKEKILTHLNRYLIADEVEIAELADEYGIVSLQGPKARQLLTELFPGSELPSKELEHRTSRLLGAEMRVIRSTHTGEEGYDLIIGLASLPHVSFHIQEFGKRFSLNWIGAHAQETLRIEAGIPRYGVDMSEETLLLEAGLDHAVSFQKGCYLGQEVVERIHSRGHVNRKLAGMVLEGETPANRGGVIRATEKEIGKITSSVFSPALKRSLALGYVHRDYLQAGTKISVEVNGTTVGGEVCSLPFYRPRSATQPA